MKRYLGIVLLIVSMTVVLCACGDKDQAQQSGSEAGSAVSEETSASESNGTSPNAPTPDPDTSADTPEESQPYYGVWSVNDFQSADTAALPEEEARIFVGDKLTYQADAVLQNDKKIDISESGYETDPKPYTEERIVNEYHTNLGEWWNAIGDVTRVTVPASEEFFGSQFFIVDDNTLWIYYEGVFFIAKRA